MPKAVKALVESGLPPANDLVFRAFMRGDAVVPPLEGPTSAWSIVAQAPARVEATPEMLRLISIPRREVWASPRLPYAPLEPLPDAKVPPTRGPWIEDVTWEASVAIHQRYMVVCEVRFAGEPGALLVQATPYDVLRDLQPITLTTRSPTLLVVHPALPVRTAKDLIQLAKGAPGQIACASGGSPSQLSCALFKSLAKIDLLMIPYKGNSLAVTSVISGETSLVFGGIAQSAPQIKSGRVRALGVTSLKRTPVMKEVPAIAESGLPGYEVSTWYGLFAPAATPRAVVDKLNAELVRILALPDVKERLGAEARQLLDHELVVRQVAREGPVEPGGDRLAPAVDVTGALVIIPQQVVPERQPVFRVGDVVGQELPDQPAAFVGPMVGEEGGQRFADFPVVDRAGEQRLGAAAQAGDIE